jgi:hypothetical protein
MTSSLPPLTQALTGAAGAAIANSVVYPLDLACARLHTLPRKDRERVGTGLYAAFAILRGRVRARGLGAIYDGLESDTAATVLSKFAFILLVFFYTPDQLHQLFLFLRLLSPSRARASKTCKNLRQDSCSNAASCG